MLKLDMKLFIALLFFSCNGPTIKNKIEKKWDVPSQKEIMQQNVWVDGCFVGAFATLRSLKYDRNKIDPFLLFSNCSKMMKSRFEGANL